MLDVFSVFANELVLTPGDGYFFNVKKVMGQEAFREWEARKRIQLRLVKAKEVQTSQKWNRLAERKDQEKRLRVRQMKRSILEYRRYFYCICFFL